MKIGKDDVKIVKYNWDDVSKALDILYLNGDISEVSEISYMSDENPFRIINLTPQGLKSFLTGKYINQRKEELYKRDLRWFTRFSFVTTFFTLVFAGIGALFSVLQYKKNDAIKVEELSKLIQSINQLKKDTLVSKVLLHPNRKVEQLPK